VVDSLRNAKLDILRGSVVDGGNALIPKPDKRRVYSLRDSSGTGLGLFHCSGPPSLSGPYR